MGKVIQFNRDLAATTERLENLKKMFQALKPENINAIFVYVNEKAPDASPIDIQTFEHAAMGWGDIGKMTAYLRLMADEELAYLLDEGEEHPLDPDDPLGPVA